MGAQTSNSQYQDIVANVTVAVLASGIMDTCPGIRRGVELLVYG